MVIDLYLDYINVTRHYLVPETWSLPLIHKFTVSDRYLLLVVERSLLVIHNCQH